MLMNWQEVCEYPTFRDIPFKVETNQWGKIEMSPATNEHGLYQALIIEWLARLSATGKPISECSIQTAKGVKVADVAWASYDFFRKNKRMNPYPESPEIIIEIVSPSNTREEMLEKKSLYFAQGAQEFWLCGRDGVMSFFNSSGPIANSQIIQDFPHEIDLNFA
jgi:Uma2 family endonuclease